MWIIIQRKKALEELLKREKELYELNIAKDKFFSIISHDLRSPFNSIIGMSKMLAQDIHELDQEEIEEMAWAIVNTSEQTYELLNMLLEWSRIQRGKMDYKPQKLVLHEIIENNISLLKPNALAKQIDLSFSTDDNIQVYADVSMLNTILRNLISNALKFTYQGGNVNISAQPDGKMITVSVSDDGMGIKPENLAKIFQVDSDYKRKGTDEEKGSGLGLILVREFVEKNGGEVYVESEFEKGSSFSFTLPRVEDI